MKKYVKDPNLPVSCSDLIICSRYYDIFKNKLEMLGLRAFLMPENHLLPEEISYHTDLSVFHAGDNRLFISQFYADSDFSEKLKESGFDIRYFEKEQNDRYPEDVGGNVCILGNKAIINQSTADPAIKKYLGSNNAVQIDVKQGYTKCNICVLDDHSIITNDRIIYEKAKQQGIDALLSDPSYIRLDGFAHGFIGGSAFKIASDRLCFTGILDNYPPAEQRRILDFLEKKGIVPIYLTDRPVFDIGGAAPVLEK